MIHDLFAWVLLKCGCQVQCHGSAPRPTTCPEHP
jgi:hypothetical protein